GVSQGRAAIVLQRAELSIKGHPAVPGAVGGTPSGAAVGLADEVVAYRYHWPLHVRETTMVAGNDGVAHDSPGGFPGTEVSKDQKTPNGSRVVRDRAASHFQGLPLAK